MKRRPADSSQAKRQDDSTAEAALRWAVDSEAVSEVLEGLPGEVGRVRRRRLAQLMGGAAACALLMVAGWAIWRSSGRDMLLAMETEGSGAIAVLPPERRTLPDGSVVELREGAQILVEFQDDRRNVSLLRGEAHFAVEKDTSRPFIVRAGTLEARAVGTAFSVGFGSGAVEVLVTEGSVAVEMPTSTAALASAEAVRVGPALSGEISSAGANVAAPPKPALLRAGERASVSHSSPRPEKPAEVEVVALSRQEIEDRLAWRAPRLEFSSAPLTEVVAKFNQFGGARIRIADVKLRALQVSGTLRANRTDALLKLLELEFGVQAERSEDSIVLRARE